MHFRIDIEFTKKLGQFKQKQICRFIHDIFLVTFFLEFALLFFHLFPQKNYQVKKFWN
jgi:hypothetical protein